MITGMLSRCGLYVGDEKDLLAADERNAGGYWEHVQMRAITDRVLDHLTARYGNPALAPVGWHDDPALDPLYQEARNLIERSFSSHSVWGWKYPQTSLIIPFWRKVVPDLRFIFCMRNPLDAISSFAASFSYTRHHAGERWLLHGLKVLMETNPEERFVTFYEEYFPDYRNGLLPVLEFLGLPKPAAGSPTDIELGRFHRAGLNHYQSSTEDLLASSDASYLMRELYFQLLLADRHASNLRILDQAEIYMPLLAKLFAAEANDHQVRHLERVLASRTHRIASSVCALLIRFRPKERLKRLTSNGTIRDASGLRETTLTPALRRADQ
jgi:hypothetical protein